MMSPVAMVAPHSLEQSVAMLLATMLRAAQLLRAHPAHAMPLAQLHGQLVAELGPDVGSYAELYLQLKKRPESFLLVDAPRLLTGAETWPKHVREQYDVALETVGLGSCVRVTLAEPPRCYSDHEDVLEFASSTLSELLAAAEPDDALRDYLACAAQQLEELSRVIPRAAADLPTTPLPDLPPAA